MGPDRGWVDRCWVTLPLAFWLVLQVPASATDITVGAGCSLAQAITAANNDSAIGSCPAGSGPDRVLLTSEVTLAEILPSVSSEITLEGNGFTIQRSSGWTFRILDVKPGGNLTLNSAVIRGGSAHVGGGIRNNRGVLTVNKSTVTANTSRGDYPWGGGIANTGRATLVNSTVSGNSAVGTYAGYGGGIANTGTVTLVNSTVSGNTARGWDTYWGGGIFNLVGSLTMVNSTVSENSTSFYSGPSVSGAQAVHRSTAESYYYYGYGAGGGIANSRGTASLTNTTLSGNEVESFWPGVTPKGGGIYTHNGPFVLANSIVANSVGGACYGAITSSGSNFGCAGPSVSHLAAALGNNGGPTKTHALLGGSNAINAAGSCATEADQRGATRLDACDSGSFEFGGCFDDGLEVGSGGSDDACPGSWIGQFASAQNHRLCDEDWVYFTPTAGATYEISTHDLKAGADTFLGLYEECVGPLATDDDSGTEPGADLIAWTAASGSRHDVAITESAGAYEDGKGYSITIKCVADCPCVAADGLEQELRDDTIMSEMVVETCNGIAVGPNLAVINPGKLTLRTGGVITFRDEFSVGYDGELAGETDTSLQAPP